MVRESYRTGELRNYDADPYRSELGNLGKAHPFLSEASRVHGEYWKRNITEAGA